MILRHPRLEARLSVSSVPAGRGAKIVQSRLNALVGRIASESEFVPCLGFGKEADGADRWLPGPSKAPDRVAPTLPTLAR